MSAKNETCERVSAPIDEKDPGVKLDDIESSLAEVDSHLDDSEYPEVRAAILPIDEDLPVNTFRAWFLGVFWTIIMAGVNQFFGMHNPPILLSSFLIILVTLPCGVIMAKVLPTAKWTFFNSSFSLNPGPFNRKEHTIIGIMSIAVSGFDSGSVAAYVWTALEKYLGIPVPLGYKFLFILSSQCMSVGFVGMFHTILVEPAYCLWPSGLPVCSLITGMHKKDFQETVANGWKIHRMTFFWITLACMTVYQFIPGFLFTALSTFAWVTWIAPNNVVVNQVFGAFTGMDFIPITFDWNQITGYLGSPLMVPAWAIANVLFAAVALIWVIAPALHWSNVWGGLYTPFSSSAIFDNTGASYNITKVLNPDFTLNEAAYHQYSPIYLSTTTVISYGAALASIISLIVHSVLYHGPEICDGLKRVWQQVRRERPEIGDVHAKLMRKYKAVPFWWYAGSFLVFFSMSILLVEYYDTGLPWWGMILSAGINFALIIPIGIMAAICNIGASTNILSVLIGGSIWSGKMVPVVLFKVLTFNTTGTGLVILRDMKIGQYMKIPPRTLFMAQMIGMLVNCIVQVGVNTWALGHVKGICTSAAIGSMFCPISQAYEASIVYWGLIGPNKLFGPGGLYNSILYFLVAGAIVPIIMWGIGKKFPNTFFDKVHIPIMLASISLIPPAVAANFMPWGVIGLFFNFYLRKYYRGWWSKYNYILAAALDAGLAIATFFIFFCLYYPGVTLTWWGNLNYAATADHTGVPLKRVAPGEHFGPDSWR